MNDAEHPTRTAAGPDATANGNGNGRSNGHTGGHAEPPRRGLLRRRRRSGRRVRIRKLRMFLLLVGFGALATVSTVFGMMMAVASDLPRLEEPAHANSVLLDSRGKEIGVLTGNERRLYLTETQIAPSMKHAIIAIEDRRFYTNDGVDLRGIARAAFQDVVHRGAVQGASTITQQFVKNALAAQDKRTVFQKLKESALAYHLTRKWSKDRILRNYLNTIYFGNGAYGIESAAQTYFGKAHPGCQDDKVRPCAAQLLPQEAALLAGIVQNPSGYDPVAHPRAAKQRRDTVLARMLEQGFIAEPEYRAALRVPIPRADALELPSEDSEYPYFTSWIKPQVVDRLGGGQTGARLAFEGGLRVKTTIDARLQQAATSAISAWLPKDVPGINASLVAIRNDTGEVRAMIGGDDYASAPFNLATQGQRQPGSAFKPFVLAEALRRGISPSSTWTSKKLVFTLKGGERFTVSNFENEYNGVESLARATTVSDNSVYAQVAKKVGPARVAKLAQRMGIRTPVSTNLAIALGGLRQGVTPLDMAHAYETFATGGKLTYGSLSPGAGGSSPTPGPAGIESITRGSGKDAETVDLPNGRPAVTRTRSKRVISEDTAAQVTQILRTVVTDGTGTRAATEGANIAGKTGTTENYGDAWFVGYTKEYTVAVWVGYPDRFKPMKTEFRGEPVTGGSYPAGIFKTFMEGLLKVDPLPKTEAEQQQAEQAPPTPVGGGESGGVVTAPEAPTPVAPASGTGAAPTATPAPTTTAAPTATAVPTTTPAPTAAPPTGGTTGGTGAPSG